MNFNHYFVKKNDHICFSVNSQLLQKLLKSKNKSCKYRYLRVHQKVTQHMAYRSPYTLSTTRYSSMEMPKKDYFSIQKYKINESTN